MVILTLDESMKDSQKALTIPEEYVVKPVTPDHLERAIEIWSLSFGFVDFDRWKVFYETMLDQTFGTYHKGDLVCLAGITHFQMWLGDRLVPCGGIAAVASDPSYRRRGLMRLAIASCLQSLHDMRVPISSLWPFSYPFYGRMGFAVSDFRYEVEANARVIPDLGDSRNYRRLSLDDWAELKPIHDHWIEKNNLSIKRNEVQWRRLLHHPQRDSYIFKHERGYIILNARNPQQRTLEIVEWAWLDQGALLDGLSLLRRMQDLHFDKVQFVCPDVDPIMAIGVTDPPFTIQKRPGVMSRVVHTEAFLEAVGADEPIFVDDPLGVSQPYGIADGEELDSFRVDPGRLVQYVTGTFKERPAAVPESLFGICAGKPAFTVEFF